MTAAAATNAPAGALEVRDQLIEALELDLVGPWPGHELSTEELRGQDRPSNWYVTDFLVPVDAPEDQSDDAGPTPSATRCWRLVELNASAPPPSSARVPRPTAPSLGGERRSGWRRGPDRTTPST
jgi:hypothetical protein